MHLRLFMIEIEFSLFLCQTPVYDNFILFYNSTQTMKFNNTQPDNTVIEAGLSLSCLLLN